MVLLYPPVGFHFAVVVFLDGKPLPDIRFQEVSGLTVTLGTEEVVEGGENRFNHKLPTRPAHQNLVLKRGLSPISKLTRWVEDAVEAFEFQPANVLVTLLNEFHLPLAAWEFVNAYPVKWAVSDFKAQENAVVIETLEMAFNFFRRVDEENIPNAS